MSGICDGRVAVITGAGRGIGREYALMLADQGAKIVVNDLGASMDGSGTDASPAQTVVEEIRSSGGEAVVNGENVADFDGAKRMVDQAIADFGRLDIVINNAGILRDRMLVNMDEAEWDAVINVHLKGTFAPARHAAAFWREQAKAGHENDARIINTSSPSGIYGNIGQSNYGAAKAGIAAFTVIAAQELHRYGVTVNAIAPAALTRMTENLGGNPAADDDEEAKDAMSPRWIAPIVTWLASPDSAKVTGRVFDVRGDKIAIAVGWHGGKPESFSDDPAAMGEIVAKLSAEAPLNADRSGFEAQNPGMPGRRI